MPPRGLSGRSSFRSQYVGDAFVAFDGNAMEWEDERIPLRVRESRDPERQVSPAAGSAAIPTCSRSRVRSRKEVTLVARGDSKPIICNTSSISGQVLSGLEPVVTVNENRRHTLRIGQPQVDS